MTPEPDIEQMVRLLTNATKRLEARFAVVRDGTPAERDEETRIAYEPFRVATSAFGRNVNLNLAALVDRWEETVLAYATRRGGDTLIWRMRPEIRQWQSRFSVYARLAVTRASKPKRRAA